jgi:imidazolonepropionase-like amidohydrolase
MWQRKILALAMLAGLLAALGAGGQQAKSPGMIVFRNANVIDGVSAEPLRNATVLVRDGRIEEVVAGPLRTGPEWETIDLGGRWLLPGFIDAHVHVGDIGAARRALQSGATTLRSMGVMHFADAGLRDLHRAGAPDLPDVLAAGYHVRTDLAPAFFLSFPKLLDLRGGASGEENARRVVRAVATRGVDWIKVNATERAGTPDTDPLKRMWSDEELAAIVAEAQAAKLPVAAHAHGDEGAAAAVRAGARSIEHGTYLSESTLAEMKRRGVCLVPTVATIVDMADPQGEDSGPALAIRGRAMVPRLRQSVAQARRLGLLIAAGTDTGYSAESVLRMPAEIIELGRSGLAPMEAIRAATSASAECLGISGRTGAIRKGLEADLVVIERDPLADLSATQEILMVVNNGAIARNRIFQ